MEDRSVQFPQRYQLKKVDGTDNIYDVIPAPGTITAEGTPINKKTLLQDETEAALFGSAANRTVDDAFQGIAFKFKAISDGLATVKVTITDEGGKPVSGVLLTNVKNDTGGMVLSDASGIVNGYIVEGTAKIAVSGYGDLEDAAIPTFTAVAGGSYTKTLTVKRRTFLDIQASKTFRFSGDVATVDVALVDGGDSGGWGNYRTSTEVQDYWGNLVAISGRGGDAGKCGKKTGIVPQPGTAYQALIGSGGAEGNTGGKSSFMGVTGEKTSGTGGTPASVSDYKNDVAGNGNSGTEKIFSSLTEEKKVGGGGGAGEARKDGSGVEGPGSGGPPGGGRGAQYSGGVNGENGADGGGGGGASVYISMGQSGDPNVVYTRTPGRGGKGRITARIHLK